MDSVQLEEFLSASLDGELSAEETALLEAELATSDAARRLQTISAPIANDFAI